MKTTTRTNIFTPDRAGLPKGLSCTLLLSTVVLLTACAGDVVRREGMSLIMSGQYEEGLAKLEQAAQNDPKNIETREILLRQKEQVLGRVLNAAGSELAKERYEAAEQHYRRALAIDPNNQAAAAGLAEVTIERRNAKRLADAQGMIKKGDLAGAKATVGLILVERPAHVKANQLRYQLEEQTLKENLAGPRLNIKGRRPVTLQFRDANLKMVLEAISRTTGVNILIDKDVRSDIKVSIFVKDTPVEETLDLILLQNQLEKRILGENTVLVYPQTPAKSKDYQELKVRRFALVNADAKQVQSMIKAILKTKDVYVDERTNAVVIRDTMSAIRLAEKLVASMDHPEPEVMLEVELLDVDRTRALDLGIDWPTKVTASVIGNSSTSDTGTVTNPLTVALLKNLNANNIGVSGLSASLSVKGSNADTKTLATPRIRVRNKEKAKIMIGDRTPVISSAAVPGSGVTTNPVFNTSIQYLETGVKLEVEPTVHLDGTVAIKVNLEVSKLGTQITTTNGTVAFPTTTNNATTVLRLKDGETQILGGLISSIDSHSQPNKIAGLGDIPYFGRLFGSGQDQWGNRELVLAITPRIIRNNQENEADLLEIWSGTETSVKYSPPDLKVAASAGVISQGSQGFAASRVPPPVARIPAPAAAEPPAAAPATPLAVSLVGPTQARVGDRINVVVNAQGTTAVNAMGFTLVYDTASLKALAVNEGDLMRRAGVKAVFDGKIDEGAGTVNADLTAEGGGLALGGGGIASVQFEVIGGRSTLVNVNGATATGANEEALPVANPQPLSIAIQPKP